MSRYVTPEEAAAILKLTRQQVYNLIKSGALQPVRKKVLHRKRVERLAARRAKQKAREQAERERQRALEVKLEAVRREFATEGGESDDEPGKV